MSTVYIRTLKRAAQILGGEEQLALHLKVTPSHLALWMLDLEPPPTHYFLKAVDIVSEHDLSLWKDEPDESAGSGLVRPERK